MTNDLMPPDPLPCASRHRLSTTSQDGRSIATPTREANRVVASTHFERRFDRPPFPENDPRSTVNDFIFNRMIQPDWSPGQLALVDKETAKDLAQMAVPALRVPETLGIVPMTAVQSADHLYDVLRPFAGTATIAKPVHASGGVTFMRDVKSSADVRLLFEVASMNYALLMREMQYLTLTKKIIVEALVPTLGGSTPDDYKFHCVHGEPLVCQVDHSRFGQAWSRLLTIPEFTPMHAGDGLAPPAGFMLPSLVRMEAMMAIARALSAPFDFVRVDLYDGADGIYFGELTFTPGGSLGVAPSLASDGSCTNVTHNIYSNIIMTALRRGGN